MSLLFDPFDIRDVTLRNRIVVSPMCMYSSPADGSVTDWHRVHLPSRAVGGAGLVFTEATAVTSQGRVSTADLGIWDDGHVDGLADIVRMIHAAGAAAGIQLGHAGAKADVPEGAVAPTDAPLLGHPRPTALTADGIAEVVAAFAAAAVRARAAGFDVVELHGAHGYLLNQFLSPLTNTREDEFGGDERRRARVLLEVVDAVRAVWDGPLFTRLSADEYAAGANRIEDSVATARLLGKAGVDLVDASSGGITAQAPEVFPGYQTPLAARIRAEAGVATGAVGMIDTPELAEFVLRSGQADLVILGREMLRDPYWPRRAAAALGDTDRLAVPEQYRRAW